MPNLNELLAERNEILAKIYEANGELTQETELAFSGSEKTLSLKIDSIKNVLDGLALDSKYFKEKELEFKEAFQVCENAIDRLKTWVKVIMKKFNEPMLQGKDYKFRVKKTTPKVLVYDETMIPAPYKRVVQKIEVDKEKIRQDLQMGIEIPGAKLEESFALFTEINKGK